MKKIEVKQNRRIAKNKVTKKHYTRISKLCLALDIPTCNQTIPFD